MTLKGKQSSFISACNELSMFMFNHQDINVKLLVKSLLRRGKGRKIKRKTTAAPRNLSILGLSEPSQRAKAWCRSCSLPWLLLGLAASSSSQNPQRIPSLSLFSSLYPNLSVSLITYAPKCTSIPFISSTPMPISCARHHFILLVIEAAS